MDHRAGWNTGEFKWEKRNPADARDKEEMSELTSQVQRATGCGPSH